MTIKPLYEGSYIIDSNKKFTPTNEPGKGIRGIKVAINPFLMQTNNDLLLIDTGLGFKNEQGNLKIYENIQNNGFSPNDITKVLLTHLHYDHIGGTFSRNSNNKMEANFKNAKYYLQAKELNKMLDSITKQEHKELLIALRDHPNTVFLNNDGQINDNIEYKITGGHTEFHQIFIIQDFLETIIAGGDVIPLDNQLNIKLVAKYDFDGDKSLEQRVHYANYLANINGICLFYHSEKVPIGRISKNNNKFTITNID